MKDLYGVMRIKVWHPWQYSVAQLYLEAVLKFTAVSEHCTVASKP